MKRADSLIAATYGASCPVAIRLLVEFAAQNSGIDPRNYYNPADRGIRGAWRDGWLSYRQECRDIGNDWKRFKMALATAAAEGITEAQVIEAAPRAFSGRLEYKPGDGARSDWRWSYCTGQYFPTEYRKAAASVLEAAIRFTRQAHPPERRQVTTIAQLKSLNEKNGGCWFDAGSMAFFGTWIVSGIIRGRYFITSEQPPHGPRAWSVRSFDDKGAVGTVGAFCSYRSKAEALAAIPRDLAAAPKAAA